MLADLDAVYIGLNLPELAAKFRGGVRLHIPAVDGAQAPVQEQEDERHIARLLAARAGLLLSPQNRRHIEPESEDAGGAQVNEVAARDAGAESFGGHKAGPPISVY